MTASKTHILNWITVNNIWKWDFTFINLGFILKIGSNYYWIQLLCYVNKCSWIYYSNFTIVSMLPHSQKIYFLINTKKNFFLISLKEWIDALFKLIRKKNSPNSMFILIISIQIRRWDCILLHFIIFFKYLRANVQNVRKLLHLNCVFISVVYCNDAWSQMNLYFFRIILMEFDWC